MDVGVCVKSLFRRAIKQIEYKYDDLMNTQPFKLCEAPKALPQKGIYFLSEKGAGLYVGRSNNIRKRLGYHTRCNHNQATFAFLLAREKTGMVKPTYKKEGSRAQLLKNPVFLAAFSQSCNRVKNMEVRVVEETDPTQQALLEIYVAYVSKAKYNSFDNH